MKSLVVANEKGGVGKSAFAVQFAHYLESQGKSALVIDLDQQGDCTRPLRAYAIDVTASSLFRDDSVDVSKRSGITVIGADKQLFSLEGDKSQHGQFVARLQTFIKQASTEFDYCVIDCPPAPGIRMTAALIAGNYIVSPIELAQESVEGIRNLLQRLQGVKRRYNPELVFLGLLPNRVKGTPLQKQWFRVLIERYANFLVGDQAKISERSAIAEAQEAGVPVWKLEKTSAREAGKELRAVFAMIVARMETTP